MTTMMAFAKVYGERLDTKGRGVPCIFNAVELDVQRLSLRWSNGYDRDMANDISEQIIRLLAIASLTGVRVDMGMADYLSALAREPAYAEVVKEQTV